MQRNRSVHTPLSGLAFVRGAPACPPPHHLYGHAPCLDWLGGPSRTSWARQQLLNGGRQEPQSCRRPHCPACPVSPSTVEGLSSTTSWSRGAHPRRTPSSGVVWAGRPQLGFHGTASQGWIGPVLLPFLIWGTWEPSGCWGHGLEVQLWGAVLLLAATELSWQESLPRARGGGRGCSGCAVSHALQGGGVGHKADFW